MAKGSRNNYYSKYAHRIRDVEYYGNKYDFYRIKPKSLEEEAHWVREDGTIVPTGLVSMLEMLFRQEYQKNREN